MNCQKCGSNINPGEMVCKICGTMVFNSPQNNTTMPQQNNPQNGMFGFQQTNTSNNTTMPQQNSMQNNSESNQQFAFESGISTSQIDENEDLINAYIRKNVDKLKYGGFSWCAFFFGTLYAFYRKMWLYGLAFFIIPIAIIVAFVLSGITIPSLPNLIKYYQYYSPLSIIAFFIPYVIWIIEGALFKKMYMNKVRNKVNKIKMENPGRTKEELMSICSVKGGTTIIPVVIMILILVAPLIFSTVIIMGILNNTRRSAAEDTAYNVLKSAERYYIFAGLEEGNLGTKVFNFNGDSAPEGLELKGVIPSAGSVTVTEDGEAHIGRYNSKTGKYEGSLTISGYSCEEKSGKITCK